MPDNTQRIVDLGIGTGLELEEIFRRFPNIEVVGLDVAESMLLQLRTKYATKNIELYCTSYISYDFGNELYDAALAVMTLHHYRHEVKASLYHRLHKCLRPNGIYIECDYMLSELEYEDAQERENFFFAEYERIKREQDITDSRDYHYDTPCTVSNQKKLLSSAGFTDIKEVWRAENNVILTAGK